MKSKFFLALAILALGLWPTLALAEVKTFDQFTVDIPLGWSTEFKAGDSEGFGANLFVSKEDQSAMVSYTLEKLKAGQWEAMLKEMTEHPKSDTGPAEIKSDNSFLVTFNDNRSGMTGREIYHRVNSDMYVKEVVIGYADDMHVILGSFQVSKREEQPQP